MNQPTDRPTAGFRRVRLLLWLLVLLALAGTGALLLFHRASLHAPQESQTSPDKFAGPFTLVDSSGNPFSSEELKGKPYAIYFGFTRCADICPTTLQRLVRLRRAVATDDALNIVFVTIDPEHDGPKEVGQYAQLFNAPIIGLTGSEAQIDKVKRQYGIFARPSDHPTPGKEMEHTAIVLLFDRNGSLTGTISPDDSDKVAIAKLKQAIG